METDISVIIPIYNTEKYLDKCLNSLRINNSRIELILINDGSIDNSLKICENFKRENRELDIKIINNSNHGVSYSRNEGISNARGKYTMFVDADDYLDENWFDIVKKLLKDDNDIVYFSQYLNEKISKSDLYRYILGIDHNVTLAEPYSKIFKTDFLKENNIKFDKNVITGEDMLFNFEAILKTDNFKIVNESFYNYRIYEGSVTKKYAENIIDSRMNYESDIIRLLNEFNIKEKNEIVNWVKEMTVIKILNNLSYLNSYKDTKKDFEVIKNINLKEIIDSNNLYSNIKFSRKIIFILLRMKFYKLVYYIYKKKNINRYKREKIKKI